MDAYVIIFAVALFASVLGFYSGFGLGTLLLPAMLLFLPPGVAVAATALVHFANNVLKVSLMWRQASGAIILAFGLPAIATALLGAWLLTVIAAAPGAWQYSLIGHQMSVTPVKAMLAGLILVFALFELLPSLRHLKFEARCLPLGGVLSGFFGGLSGHQGALRSAFLVKTGIQPAAFVATNAAIGFMVDLARLAVYAAVLVPAIRGGALAEGGWRLIVTAIIGAFIGVVISRRYIHKTTIAGIQTLVGILLLAVALFLGLGLI